MLFKIVTLTFIGIVLSSCHPSDNGTSSLPVTAETKKSLSLRGSVVDGYISGANVCVYLDNIELNCTQSDENGSYSFPPLLFSQNASFDIRATGGLDTASGRERSGDVLLQHIELTEELEEGAEIVANITPLSDLVSMLVSSDASITPQEAKEMIADAYEILREKINADPMQENSLFVASQDIERSKELLEVMIARLYEDLPPDETLQTIKKEIRLSLAKSAKKSASESRKIFFLDAIDELVETRKKSALETNTTIADIPDSEKLFVIFQRNAIVEALQGFVQTADDLSPESRAEFQKRLVSKTQEALDSFVELERGELLRVEPIVIDIFADDTNETTDPDDTNETTDPDDANQSTPEPEPQYTITGVMVDGYIDGATLCIDTNNDARCETNEPRTTTQEDGSFSLTTQALEENRYYRVIAYGGRDTSTQKDFAGEYFGILETSALNAHLFITPINDMVARMFFRSSELSASSLQNAQNAIAQSMGVNSTDLNRDPMSLKNLMLASTGVESIYAVLASILKSHLSAQNLTQTQENIARESMLEEFLDSGYSSFDGSRAVIRMELKLGIAINDALHEFAREQIAQNLLKLNNLDYPNSIEGDAFENIQRVFDKELALALQTNSYREINASVEVVLHSKFDKTGAIFDKNACLQNETYSNAHAQTSDAQRYIDSSNGIIMGFVTTEDPSHQSFTLFYPPLGDVTKSDVLVRFESDYFFSYDAAWIETGKSVYLETLSASDVTKCYAIELNKLYGSDLHLQPVFRYTDAP